ncbi:MAG: YifB family Mg chelatase-like AAA ATPase [Alphaproteobacteria bacterium]|nr:YifB family Mg chelatase-like AAA ATPase [Alphaproteobacteria bacterium]
MVARIHTVTFQGIETLPVEVQVHLGAGLPAFTVVGLPDKAVAESRERVRAALASMGVNLPAKRILVNLAPADVQKEGSHFDVPIALGMLVVLGMIPADALEGFVALGELALDGQLQPVAGVLPAALGAAAQNKGIICPEGNGVEAAFAGDVDILAPSSLLALVNHIKGQQVLARPEAAAWGEVAAGPDLAEVRGQAVAKRALEIAAAGGHNLLMMGPPGSGKSMLAACLPGILPPMRAEEALETNLIASVAGKLMKGGFLSRRPFRDPHHSSSMASMVGGGRRAVPGEISLAHHGVLFMDELPEYPRGVLESLRQPLETGQISIARVEAHVTYPARFQLIAAMNPCRCGYLEDAGRACNKAPRCAGDYQARISGPLLDRIDLHVDVPAVDTLSMLAPAHAESSAQVAARVARARAVQQQRFAAMGIAAQTNAQVSGDNLQAMVQLDAESTHLLEHATRSLQLSMRGLTRVLRIARTIADLEQAADVGRTHLAEALSYRQQPQGRFLDAA